MDITKMDEVEKKKKGAFSFLRAIGLDSNKNDTSNKNAFYVGNAVTAIKNKKKETDVLKDLEK